MPFCRAYGLGIIPYFPLEGGILTGQYRPGKPAPSDSRFAGRTESEKHFSKRNFSILVGLERFSEKRERPVLELALAWLLANPLVSSVIAGATKPQQVVANARALVCNLSAEELNEIDEIQKDEGDNP